MTYSPFKRAILTFFLALAAALLLRCHSPVGGSLTSSLAIGSSPLSNTEWSLIAEVADASFRRTGGCRALQTNAAYDGCVFQPNPGATIKLGLKICQNGNQALLQITDFSRDAYPDRENTGVISDEVEDCWTAAGLAPPETRTPCFAGTASVPGNFYVPGDIIVVPDVGFRFRGITTRRIFDADESSGSTNCSNATTWFTSDTQLSSNSDLGGWPGRIAMNLDVIFAGDTVSGRLEYWDYDPDRTATTKCLNACPQRQGLGRCPFLNYMAAGTNCVFDGSSIQPPFFDLFPYCNPRYLTERPCLPFHFDSSFATTDSCGPSLTQRHTCDYAPCPPFTVSTPGLRVFPFCAWADQLPCEVTGVSEAHTDCPTTHPGNPGTGLTGYDAAAQRCDSRISHQPAGGPACDDCCFIGPRNCCNGAPPETSWNTCRADGVRPLGQPMFSRFLTGTGLALTALNYRCPLENVTPDQFRNRLIPFDCGTAGARSAVPPGSAQNLAGPDEFLVNHCAAPKPVQAETRNDCPADDVYIIFNLTGGFVTGDVVFCGSGRSFSRPSI